MVAQHYRWDFIGLSTDTKPTPETSEKVVDGSTYYTSDNSKLYVWCKDQWYEKEVEGGGGGGGSVQPSDYMYDLGKFYKKWKQSPTPEDPFSITTAEYEEVYNAIRNNKILLLTMDDLEESNTFGVFTPANYDFIESSGTHVLIEVYFVAGGGLELHWENGNPTATFYL